MSAGFDRVPIEFRVNGKAYERTVEPRMLLVELIREELDLCGTHIGCDTTFCGACTVLLNGGAVKSCTMFAFQAHQGEITTVEGLANGEELHPAQKAFAENHGLQCGYCTPGFLMSTVQLLSCHPNPTDKEIRKAIAGNTCRCTGYQNILKAIRAAANATAGTSAAKIPVAHGDVE
jgi:carbon-monoxide dehydrogenase small subunit